MLEKIQTGLQKKPLFLMVFGVAGIGKSSFAARFDKPLFADLEKGSGQLSVDRITEFSNLTDVHALLDELIKSKHSYKTFVLDTLDSLERLVWKDVCEEHNKKSIEEIPYGKGYVLALKQWEQIVRKLDRIRESINVVVIAHSTIRRINDPMQLASYDQFTIKVHQQAAALFKEAVDAVLFAAYEIFVQVTEGQTKGKALGEGNRVLYTSSMPGHEGKNRFGLPYMMPLDYDKFMSELNKGDDEKKTVLYEKIKAQIPSISDPQTREKAKKHLETNKENLGELMKIDRRVQEYMSVGAA